MVRRLSVARTGPWWCLLAALAVALLGGSLPPFVLPGVPVVLRGVHLVVVLLAAAACWALAGGFARARAGAGTPGGGAEGRPGPGRTGAVRVAWGLFAGLMALGIAGFHEFGTTSTMLTPRSPSGCAVLATEHSFLMAARGEVGVLDRGWGPAWRVGEYAVDDGGTPAASGDYALTWSDADSGLLELRGAPGQPVYEGALTSIECR